MSFIHKKCRLESTAKIPSQELYKEYERYSLENKVPALDPIAFGKELAKLQVEKKKMQFDKERKYYYSGIALLNTMLTAI